MLLLSLILFMAAFGWLGWVRMGSVAAYFQQEEYDNRRFARAWPRLSMVDYRFSVSALVISLITGLLGWQIFGLVLGAGLAVVVGVAERKRQRNMKKPLVRTARAQKLIRLSAALAGSCALILVLVLGLLGAIIAIQIVPAMMILANVMLAPAQQAENQTYIRQARDKLARFPGVKIGITGSFGKTTVKHALGDTLGQLSTVFYSTGSVNTQLGLTRHVRQRLQPAHRYFVAEMGAYGEGSVQRLCTLVDPDHAIITSIGLAHNERFKGLEVVARAKSELAAWVAAKGGKVVMTQDVASYAPFADIIRQYPDQCVVVGEDVSPRDDGDGGRGGGRDELDYRIQNVATGIHGTSLTLVNSRNGVAVDLTLPLLGAHNSDNLGLMAALLLELGWDETALRSALGGVRHVPHRLAPRDGPNGATILDDAYNANPVGMRNAISLAADMAAQNGGQAYMISPGLVELGDAHDSVHRSIGEHARAAQVKAIIVTPERVPSLIEGLEVGGSKVETAASYLDARAQLDPILKPGDVLLIANDLPDLLGSRVWL